MQSPESAAIRAPHGRRRARLSCNFGFRDKCSLPFSGGTELLPAIKALRSNSSFPRECNFLPPVIKAPLVAAVLPAQPSSDTAGMGCSCSSSLARGLQHTTPSALPVQLRMHLCNQLEQGISPAEKQPGRETLSFCESSSKLDQIPDPYHSRATDQHARRAEGPVRCRREDETSSRERLEREYQKLELVLKT